MDAETGDVRRGRPVKGSELVDGLEGSDGARLRLKLVIETLAWGGVVLKTFPLRYRLRGPEVLDGQVDFYGRGGCIGGGGGGSGDFVEPDR
jgi:hypothetical protein